MVFVSRDKAASGAPSGRELLADSALFAETVRACDTVLLPYTGWSVEAVLRGEPAAPALERIDVVQPTLFTMSIALAAVWRSLGIEPSALVGHSQGEMACAVVSGALSLADGARVIALRSQLQQRLAGTGAMAFVELPLSEVERRLRAARWAGLSVAVVNTHTSTVVTGDPTSLQEWTSALEREGVFCRRIASEVAGHTPSMDPILDALKQGLAGVTPRQTSTPMVSTVTSQPIQGEALDAAYWCRNVREPVRLDRALSRLLHDGYDTFIEISPHPVLFMALAESAGERGSVVGSLRREEGGLRCLLSNLGRLHAEGYEVDLRRIVGSCGDRLAALPSYAFQRERYWLDLPRLGAAPFARRSFRPDTSDDQVWSEPEEVLAQIGDLEPAARLERIRSLVCEGLRAVLRLEAHTPLPLSARPIDLGLNSLMSVELTRLLKARTGVPAQAARVLRADSVQEVIDDVLQAVVASGAPRAEASANPTTLPAPRADAWLVAVQEAERPRFRLLCFPYSGGSAAAFGSWRGGLPEDVEILAVELPGRGLRHQQPALASIDELVVGVGAALAALPDLPLLIFGHSLGAIAGFEFARHWLSSDRALAHLFVSGAVAPRLFSFPSLRSLSDAALLDALAEAGLSGLAAMRADSELMRMGLASVRQSLNLVRECSPARARPVWRPR